MNLVYNKKYSSLDTEKSIFCCDYLKKQSEDEDLGFDVVTDSYYDLIKQKWIKVSEPYPALVYKVPSYYGEVNTDYMKINRCPFCGKRLTLDGESK